jgi:hypothetical protein
MRLLSRILVTSPSVVPNASAKPAPSAGWSWLTSSGWFGFDLTLKRGAPGETPHLGIFWMVQTPNGEVNLLTASCPLDQAEPYGDCLTYSPGHYETWAHWRRDKTVDPALRALVRSYEYEDWPRGRIVFYRARDLFILYADRKLLTPATVARIEAKFHLLAERTEVQSDWHYQSTETPNAQET